MAYTTLTDNIRIFFGWHTGGINDVNQPVGSAASVQMENRFFQILTKLLGSRTLSRGLKHVCIYNVSFWYLRFISYKPHCVWMITKSVPRPTGTSYKETTVIRAGGDSGPLVSGSGCEPCSTWLFTAFSPTDWIPRVLIKLVELTRISNMQWFGGS